MCVCLCVRPPQLPLSSSHLDVYTGPGMKGPAIAMTSNSCPANLTIKRELSGAKVNAILSQTTKINNCVWLGECKAFDTCPFNVYCVMCWDTRLSLSH